MRGHGFFFMGAVCFLILLAGVSSAGASAQELVWKDVSNGIMDSDLRIVEVSPENADIVYTSSFDAVYKTVDGGKKWNGVLSFRGTGNAVNAIAVTPAVTGSVYAGTDGGLYRSNDGGRNWEKIFKGIGDSESSVLSIAVNPVNPEIIFIGTGSGLFRTDNGGINWRKVRNIPSGTIVSSITIDRSNHHIVYAAADKGLYKSLNSGVGWKRIYETHLFEENNDTSIKDEPAETDEIKIKTKIRSIAVDPADGRTVYVGTSEGLLVTGDGGLTWKTAGSSGLTSRDIRHIAINPSEIDSVYAATGRGVFRYSKITKSWEELYKGLASADIRYLAFSPSIGNKSKILWAVTKRGVFKTAHEAQQAGSGSSGIKTGEAALSRFAYEPSIEEIREAAIIYAEVHPDKINRWRKAAANKAWLPDLKVGYDKGKDWQSSTYFYSTSKEKYTDDDITAGKDRGWSISLTWELGDLIWNSAQTSIDSRSRLMVQLRDDVLNEVTRLYFERRRLQYEMLLSPPAEIKNRIEKDLRLQELTANIDALTGSYLSKKLPQVRRGKM